MKKKIFMFFLLCLLILPLKAYSLEVTSSAIARYIQNRAPVAAANSFLSSVGKLYCFSHINGAENETRITHLWLFEGQEMARVELPVRSSSWRTWSSKALRPEWIGAWEVKILDENENLLDSVLFRLE
jgi:Protein of unknown function (DUF2914)